MSDLLLQLSAACRESIRLQRELDQAEELVKALRVAVDDINTKTIPDMVFSLGIRYPIEVFDENRNEIGRVEVKEFIKGALPKDHRREAALEYIEAHDGADLIKNQVSMNFDRDQGELAGDVIKVLSDMNIPFKNERTVHPQTLHKFAKDRDNIPFELLGLYAGSIAKITLKD